MVYDGSEKEEEKYIMNQEKIGKFIAELRRKENMTQGELGEKLGVTDKTISRWETGKYMPDISLFKPLSEILKVSINDLMSGEIVDKKNYQETFEENVMGAITTVDEANKKADLVINILLGIIAIFLIGLSSYLLYMNASFKIKYNPNNMAIEACDTDKTCPYKFTFKSSESHSKMKYLLTKVKEKDDEVGLIFITTWHTLENIVSDKRNTPNDEFIDLSNKLSYGTSISIRNAILPKHIKIYYTNEDFSKIANADYKTLNKIIKKSDLMYES